MLRPLILATAALLALPAAAHDRPAYTYEAFEVSVPHIDLETCPDGLATGDVFCRVTMNNDALHIHVFETAGDRHFVSVHTYHADEFELLLGR
ncbi:MAG: hypothetical protein JJU19_12050 [Pararhodobacter sp.]|nr:hypothetical protein [Pararhodobacter sp.]